MIYSKRQRQEAFLKESSKFPVEEATKLAKLIPNVNQKDFKIVKLHG